ncbi:hypothetical protein D3C85_1126160 [compost metagenome]
MGNLLIGISPDLRTCSFIMSHIIIRIRKLVQQKVAFMRSFFFCIITANLYRFQEGYFCSVGFHRQGTFPCRVCRHHQFDLQVVNACNHRQCDPCISACRFNQLSSFFNIPSFHCTTDHIQGCTIFHTSSRVIAFQFCIYFHIRIGMQFLNLY